MKMNRHFYGWMGRLLTVAAFLMLVCNGLNAKPISRAQALQQAAQFMKQQHDGRRLSPVSLAAAGTTTEDNCPYYAFNRGDGNGFVIIAGDDAVAESVLGYTDNGQFDYDQLPPNMKEWLDDYARQIEWLATHPVQGAVRRVSTHPAVAQLMSSKWNQGAPYNDECPEYFNQGRSVTGCVATAYAQILYYQREKMVTETQAAMPAYTGYTAHPTYGNLHVNGIPAGSPIDWDAMTDTYGNNSSARSKQAVAQLMHYCGVGVKMDYTNSASGAQSYEVYNSLRNYFGFGNSVRYISYQTVSTDDEWDALAYQELAEGRPFYISGSNDEVGHAFVCDGYDGNRRYHINWGWGGQSDGHYYLSNLTPGQQGIGGSSDGYNAYREIIIGIEPENYMDKTMNFSDGVARKLCTDAWDQNGDGKLSYGEAAAVESLGKVLAGSAIKTFNELHYFIGLTTIDAEAFEGCNQLTTVQLPKQLKSIGDRAFKGCVKLHTIRLTDVLTALGEETFSGCKALKSIDLPIGVRILESRVFEGCDALTSMTLPTGMKRLGDGTFANCQGLSDFTVKTMRPESIEMGSGVFDGASLQQTTLNVMQGTRAFFAADAQWQAFGNIKELRDISYGHFAALAEGQQMYLHHVGSGRYLTKGEAWGTQAVVDTGTTPMRFVLRHLSSMPEGVYQITSDDTDRDGHFLFRTSTDGNVGQGVQAAFVDGTSLTKNAYWKVTDLGDNTYTLSIPEGYTNYQEGNCWGVQTDHKSNAASPTWGVYSDVPYEGHELDCQWRFVLYDADLTANFQAAKALQVLVDMADARHVKCEAERAVLENMESTTQQLLDAQKTLRQRLNLVNFEDELVRQKCIANFDIDADGELSKTEASQLDNLGTLFYNTAITTFDEMQLFTSLTTLYGNSFENCSKLESIVLPESIERIYYRAFRNCSSLTSINLPEYLDTLGDNAFDGCRALTTVTVTNPDPSTIALGNNVFRNISLQNVTLQVPAGSKDLYEQAPVWKDFGNIVEVRTRTKPQFSPISEGVVGYIYNVATRKFIDKGEAYGTQAVVSRKGMQYEWRRTKSMDEGQYFLYSSQTGKDGKVLFRTSSDTKVGEGVKACFVDGNTGTSAYWQVVPVGENIYTLQVPVADASYVEGEYLGTQSDHRNDAYSPTDGIYSDVTYLGHEKGCQWAFITLDDMKAAEELDATIAELKTLLLKCEEQSIAKDEEQAVYDNLSSTAQEIRDAVLSLRDKLHYITFADSRARDICLENWDQNADGELSREEAAEVRELGEIFRNQSSLKSLDELRYFTALTEIPENAFRNSSSLLSIYLPQQVTSLGKYAFTGCSALKYVVVMNEEGVVPFASCNVPSAATIFVPGKLVESYLASDKWQDYAVTEYTGIPVVKPQPASRIYGRAVAPLKFEVKGAPINGEPEMKCDEITDATTPVGTYVIHTLPGTITSRGLICEEGEFSVTPAALTITAKSYTRKQGEENPEFEVTYKGFRNRETYEVLTQQPVVSCEATPDSPAGEYAITVSGAAAQNYEITYVDGMLTVVASDAIAGIAVDAEGDGVAYDMQGRRVKSPTRKGVYVTSQKKKVVKR